ncbi:MAG TPA: type II and III secretion system protein family protein [Alphaproteobacteria bacterium]|nr:type II and III secretion system protein family protein [Alphaproteobacteria bacterium]
MEDRPGVTVEVGKALLMRVPQMTKTVLIADPEVADVQVSSPTSLMLLGKKPGVTTLYVMTDSGGAASYPITVLRQTAPILAAMLKEVPAAKIELASTPDGIVVSGTVPSPREANKLKTVAQQYLGEKDNVIFNVSVTSAVQVNLRVRVAEVSRSVAKNFSFNWDALYNNGKIAVGLLTGRSFTGTGTAGFGQFTANAAGQYSLGSGYKSPGGSLNVQGLIDALVSEGLITVLAEPNLTAISGETADFLAGGEFPIPVPQAGTGGATTITIDYKTFGVGLDFTPTVLDENRMSIKVKAEVSELTTTGAITIDGFTVPALDVRRAQTTVELGSGESFAIAGLFQNNVTSQINSFPWLGDVPVLGALFRSTSFQRNESELVIIVTPYVVHPVAQSTQIRSPTDGLTFSSDLEQLLLGRTTTGNGGRPETMPAAPPQLHGTAGFMLE